MDQRSFVPKMLSRSRGCRRQAVWRHEVWRSAVLRKRFEIAAEQTGYITPDVFPRHRPAIFAISW